jgi:hypothetical protein
MRLVGQPLTLWLLLLGSATLASAAELSEQASLAYNRYLEDARRVFDERVRRQVTSGSGTAPVSDGDLNAHPGRQDGIISVPGGLVHHWIGTTFIAGITLEDALAVSCAYDDYHTFYKSIVASRLLGRDDNTYRTLLRIKESAGGLSAVLDVRTTIQYFYPSNQSVYSISTSEEIREVKEAGSPRERYLPAGKDSGYLWRAATLNRLVERNSGVFVEMETLGLSRSFPPLLGWIIEPIARSLGRKSVEVSLQEFRSAVRARKR